jgi:hypothetical protein
MIPRPQRPGASAVLNLSANQATITKWLNRAGFDGEFGILVAIKEYPRMRQQYESEGAIYGNNHLGLIRWIDKRYESNIW